jgi:two-component system KDP operon response regulator KdpE
MGGLTARMRAPWRLAAARGPTDPPAVRIGGLTIDLARRVVLLDGTRAPLTPHEYAILTALTRARGKVVAIASFYKTSGALSFSNRRTTFVSARSASGTS